MSKQSVSVIIPTYNAEKNIVDCVMSACRQNLADVEIIVVDDGSTDRTREIVREAFHDNKNVRLLSQTNSGVSAARNAGLSEALGRYVTFLDADDELAPNSLERMLASIVDSNADMIYGRYELFGEGMQTESMCEFPDSWYGTVHRGREVLPLLLSLEARTPSGSACRALYNLEFLRQAGACFPEGIRMSEDYCFVLELLSNDPLVGVIDEVVYRYRQHSESATKNYMPSMKHDMDYVNNIIARICCRNDSLLRLYRDCVANTCLCVVQNELRAPERRNKLSRCSVIFRSQPYRRQLVRLDKSSTLHGARYLLMKTAGIAPSLAAMILIADHTIRGAKGCLFPTTGPRLDRVENGNAS